MSDALVQNLHHNGIRMNVHFKSGAVLLGLVLGMAPVAVAEAGDGAPVAWSSSVLREPVMATGVADAPQPMTAFVAEASPGAVLKSAEVDSISDVIAEPEPGHGVTLPPPDAAAPVPLAQCPYDMTHAKSCRMHWWQMSVEAGLYLAFQNVGNAYTGYWYRWETTNGKWWDRYVNSVEDWRWNHWADQNPFLDDYIGHGMMGMITNSIWEQNDPLGMTVVQANDWVYWRSRLRATAFSTFFSYEWKLGPIGEAGMHNGDHFFFEKGEETNETGWVELVSTPLDGLAWNVLEDYLDRTLILKLENHSRNPFSLLGVSFITPGKSMANILRFRPPWYRDSRVVKAKSFWADPPDAVMVWDNANGGTVSAKSNSPTPSNLDTAGLTAAWNRAEDANAAPAPSMGVSSSNAEVAESAPAAAVAEPAVKPNPVARVTPVPVTPSSKVLPWGGVHEFGVIWGFSVMTGHLLGNQGDVKTMPIAVRYSYLLHANNAVALRYAPEFTAMSMIDWPTPESIAYNSADINYLYDQRTRAYGAGISPIGFQADLLPKHRVQPFFSTNEGAIYYDQPVFGYPKGEPYPLVQLPTGPKLLWVGDLGFGINVFHHRTQEITLGYRYQHMTGENAASQWWSTDANVFYVGVSRFRTRHSRDAE
jgi:hypothetical protein